MNDRCDVHFAIKLSILVFVGILIMFRSNIDGEEFLRVNESVRTNMLNRTLLRTYVN